MKNNRIFFAVIVVVVVVIIIVKSVSTTKTQTTQQSISIGGVFALTGLGASQGEEELKGAKLAIDEINAAGGAGGRQLKLVVEDVSLDKLNVAASVASKLIDVDKVSAIVGTTWDEPAQVIVPIADKAKVPMVGQDQTRLIKKDNPYSYFFTTWYRDEVGIDHLLAYAKSKGFKKIGVLRPVAGGYYQYVSDYINQNVSKYGITIIDDININNPEVSDFRSYLTNIKADKPDAIFVVLNGFTECPFLKQVSDLKLNVPVLSVESAGDYPSLGQCANLMQNIYFSYPKESSKYSAFATAFQAKYSSQPETPSVMTAYDAVKIIAKGLETTNGVGGAALRDAIKTTSDYKGVSLDSISFDEMGYVITPNDAFEVRTVRNSKFVTVQ